SFYVSNGFSSTTKYTGLVEKYDVAKNTWSVLTSSLVQKQFSSSVIVDSNLYVFNGLLSDGSLNKKMEVVNIHTGAVIFSTDNPQPAYASGAAVWKSDIYIFGGNISPEMPLYSNKLYKFETSTQKWIKLASMPEEKETKGVIVNGKLY